MFFNDIYLKFISILKKKFDKPEFPFKYGLLILNELPSWQVRAVLENNVFALKFLENIVELENKNNYFLEHLRWLLLMMENSSKK